MGAEEIITYCKQFVSGNAEQRMAARQRLLTCAPFLSVADEFRKTGFSFLQVAEFIACDELEPLGRLAILRPRALLEDAEVGNGSPDPSGGELGGKSG